MSGRQNRAPIWNQQTAIVVEFVGGEVVLSIVAGSSRVSQASIPQPRVYGEHELIVSPSERYFVFYWHSGQNDFGYEVFEIGAELRHLFGATHAPGNGTAPAFSPDEQYLAVAWEPAEVVW